MDETEEKLESRSSVTNWEWCLLVDMFFVPRIFLVFFFLLHFISVLLLWLISFSFLEQVLKIWKHKADSEPAQEDWSLSTYTCRMNQLGEVSNKGENRPHIYFRKHLSKKERSYKLVWCRREDYCKTFIPWITKIFTPLSKFSVMLLNARNSAICMTHLQLWMCKTVLLCKRKRK